MRLRKVLCTALSVLMMLTFSTVTVSAADKTKNYSLEECGLSLDIPTDFNVLWTKIDENDSAIKNFGFGSKDELISTYLNEYGFILDAYDSAASAGDTGYNIHVAMFDTTAKTVNDDVLKTDFENSYLNLFQIKLGNDVTYAVEENNGVSYLNAQYVASNNGFTVTGNHYCTVTADGKAIDICAIARQKDKQDEYAEKVNAYIADVMKSVKPEGGESVADAGDVQPASSTGERTTYNLGNGISFSLENNWNTVWREMPEDSPLIQSYGYVDKNDLIKNVLDKYNQEVVANTENNDYNFHIYTFIDNQSLANLTGADENTKEKFKNEVIEYLKMGSEDPESINVLESEIVNCNGIEFERVLYNFTEDNTLVLSDYYITSIDNKFYCFYTNCTNPQNLDESKKELSEIMSAIMSSVTLGNSPASASQSTGSVDGRTTYNLSNGISFSLENNWDSVWREMPEDSPVIQKFGFDNKNDIVKNIIDNNQIDFYSSIDNDSYGFFILTFDSDPAMPNLTGADDRSKEIMKNEVIKAIKSNAQDPDSVTEPEFEIVEINGIEFEHFVYDEIRDGILVQTDCYTTIIDCVVYSLNGEATGSQNPDVSKQELSSYMSSIMSSVSFGEPASAKATAESDKMSVYEKITSFDFPMWIIVIILAVILFIGSSLAKKGEWQDEPLSLDKSKCIQGFCAVAIILHHLAQKFAHEGDIGALGIFTDIGVMFVGIFFFFSGYGLFKSLKTKEGYLKGFFKKRLPAILVPFYVCILIFVAFNFISGTKFGIGDTIAVLTGWGLINSHMWYIVEIAILYVIFFFVFRFIKKENFAIAIMGILTACLTAGSLLLGHGANFSCRFWFMGEWWYNTTLVFFVGILIAKNENALTNFAKKAYKLILPLSIVITVVLGFFTKYALNKYSYWAEWPGHMGYKEKFICLGFQLPMVLFAVITLLLIMMKLKFTNPILKFLGTISLELYLIHNLFLQGLGDNKIANITGPAMYVVLTILLSIALATIVSRVDKYIIALIAKKKTAVNLDSKKVHSIDCMRYIMAFFVVCIHIPFISTAGNVAIAFGKTAVPFFLVVCGYFLYRDDNNEFFARLKKQAKKILLLTIGANILFGALSAVMLYIRFGNLIAFSGNFTAQKITDFLLYNMSPFADHLWYLGSLLYALLILMILCKTKLHKYVMFISPVLLGVYIALSWFGHAEYYVYRNALFVTLPYVMMGCLIKRYEDKLMKIKTPILWVITAVLCVTTIVELNTYRRGIGVPFFSAEILVYVIVLLLLKYRDFGKDTLLEKLGSKCSLFIYIVHMIPILIIWSFIPQTAGFISFFGPVTVFIITTLAAVLFKIKYFLPEKPAKDKTITDTKEKVLEKVN